MRCGKCRAPLARGDRFCQECGWKVRRRGRWVLSGVFLLLLIGAGIVWAWWEGWIPRREHRETSCFTLLDGTFTERAVTDRASALAAVGDAAEALGMADPAAELCDGSTETYLGSTYYRFAQQYEGVPVYGRSVVVSADSTGAVLTLTGNYRSLGQVDLACPVTEAEALAAAAELYGGEARLTSRGTCVYSLRDAQPELAWHIFVTGPALAENCFLSAQSGEVLFRESQLLTESVSAAGTDVDGVRQTFSASRQEDGTYLLRDEARNITVYNAGGRTVKVERQLTDREGNVYHLEYPNWLNESGQTVRIEQRHDGYVLLNDAGETVEQWNSIALAFFVNDGNGDWHEVSPEICTDNSWSAEALSLLTWTAATCDFYEICLGRQGFNGANGAVHLVYNDHKNGDVTNAYSSSEMLAPATVLVFGQEADLDIDLVAHEYTHSVEGLISDMVYTDQSGALMEAYSDLFGEIVEDWWDDGLLNGSCDWAHGDRNAVTPSSEQDPYCSYVQQGESCPVAAANKGIHMYNSSFTVTKNSCILRAEYPAKYLGDGYLVGEFDSGNVHHNSTVIFHTAYLMSRGIDGSGVFEPLTTANLAELFYSALFSLPQDCTFSQFCTVLERQAEILLAQGRLTEGQVKCVAEAFRQANIFPAGSVICQMGTETDLMVYDLNEALCDDYIITLTASPTRIAGPVRPGDSPFTGGEVTKYTVSAAEPFRLSLSPGFYLLTVTDGTDRSNSQDYRLLVTSGGPEELTLYTDFGQYRPDGFDRYLTAARRTCASGSWQEIMDMEADVRLAALSGLSAHLTMSYDLDVSGYFPSDLSALTLDGSASMSVLGQQMRWDLSYAGGTARYTYTQPQLPAVELEIPPASFPFAALTRDMVVNASLLPAGTARFTIRGEAFDRAGLGAMAMAEGMTDLRYGDVAAEAVINEESGRLETLTLTFTAYLTYNGAAAEADYTITYRFGEL